MWIWVRAAVHWRLGQMVHGTFQMFPQDKCWTCLTNEPCQYFIFVKYQEIPTAVENVKTCLIKGFQLCVVRQFLVCRLLIREMARLESGLSVVLPESVCTEQAAQPQSLF